MGPEDPAIEDCKANDGVRLMSVLQEIVRDKGVMEAARVLGVNYKTLVKSMKAGRLSKKMRWAVERTLQGGEGCAAAGQRERSVRVWKRLDELEEELRSGLGELRTALDGQRKAFAGHLEEFAGLEEDHARHQRRVERQLAALALGHAVAAPETAGIEEYGADESEVAGTSSGPPWWRPGKAAEDRVMDLVHEWWLARNSLLASEERVNIA